MTQIANDVFLRAIFSNKYQQAHVAGFFEDPNDIPPGRRGICWAGSAFSEFRHQLGANEYYTVSLFSRDPQQPHKSLRRKALFQACHVFLLDDVGEKLDDEAVARLPDPSYILQTSPGSQQWGYILKEPETKRHRIDNLHDGLIAKGLTPDSTDPGQKGVTRYGRLPEGSNRKLKYVNGSGEGFDCRLIAWYPDRKVDLDQLAEPFGIDLDQVRSESDAGVTEISGELTEYHPALKYIEIIEKLGAGKYSVICPWVDHHTAGDTSGTAIFLSGEGRVGFKCHHGHCQDRDWSDVLQILPSEWMWAGVKGNTPGDENIAPERLSEGLMVPFVVDGQEDEAWRWLWEARDRYLYIVSQDLYYDRISGTLISGTAFNKIFDRFIPFVKGEKRHPPTTWFHRSPGAVHVDKLGWMPWGYGEKPQFFYRYGNATLANSYSAPRLVPERGSVEMWTGLLGHLIPDARERTLLVQWLAYVIRFPHKKIGWQIVWQGKHRNGKDSVLRPIAKILEGVCGDITNEDLETGWGDYWAQKVLVTVQEIYQPRNRKFENFLKTLAAPTNTEQKVFNLKGGRIVVQPNIVKWLGFTNHADAMHLDKEDFRYFVINSDVPRLVQHYYDNYHRWIDRGGSAAVLHHLVHEVDLSDFDPAKLPYQTAAYHAMSDMSRPDWAFEMMEQLECEPDTWRLFGSTRMKKFLNQNRRFHTTEKAISQQLKNSGYVQLSSRGRIMERGISRRTPWLWCLQQDVVKYENMKEKELYEAYVFATPFSVISTE